MRIKDALQRALNLNERADLCPEGARIGRRPLADEHFSIFFFHVSKCHNMAICLDCVRSLAFVSA